MKTQKIDLPGPPLYGAGRAKYHLIESTGDPQYGSICMICGRRAIVGSVLVEMIEFMREAGSVVCTPCLEIIVDGAPVDGRSERMAKIKAESKLRDWIMEPNASMESL